MSILLYIYLTGFVGTAAVTSAVTCSGYFEIDHCVPFSLGVGAIWPVAVPFVAYQVIDPEF